MRGYRQRVPARYLLHLVVVLLIPLASLASQTLVASPLVLLHTVDTPQATPADTFTPPAPLSLDTSLDDVSMADAAFAAIDALPATNLPPDLLALQPMIATIAVDSANVRGGPGTNYDKVAELTAGTPVQILARVDGWYQARARDGKIVWIADELLNLDIIAADFLPEAANIPAPPPAKIGLVAEEGLNLRDGPGKEYIGITKLTSGAQLDLLARYNDWFQVQTTEGQIGWVVSQYLAIGPNVVERVEVVPRIPDASPALVGVVREPNVNLRSGPNVAYEKRGGLGAGVQLDLLGRYKDWYKVRTASGSMGWVSSELMNVSSFVDRRVPMVRDIPALPQSKPVARSPIARSAAPAPAEAVGSLTAFATQFIGARYVWGGTSPKGFDCSGFTKYVYAQFGLNLPHSSVGQYSSQYGTPISKADDLRPGDIVFFVNTYKRGISHVGIYIGGGDVVQAMSPRLGVGVANLNGGYWAAHYYGAIRPTR